MDWEIGWGNVKHPFPPPVPQTSFGNENRNPIYYNKKGNEKCRRIGVFSILNHHLAAEGGGEEMFMLDRTWTMYIFVLRAIIPPENE